MIGLAQPQRRTEGLPSSDNPQEQIKSFSIIKGITSENQPSLVKKRKKNEK
jgi:hypothetical protein